MAVINRQSFGSSSNSSTSRDAMSGIFKDAKDSILEELSAKNHSFSSKVINSPAYQDAYRLFSSLNDKSWLMRLEQIPYQSAESGSTLLDQLGFSSAHDNNEAQRYNTAMQSIANLVSEYQQYVNTLPETQANQQSVIGVNSAITGQNIGNSDISPNQATSPTYESNDSSGLVLGAANFLLSATNGFADIALKFKDLGLRNIRQSFDIDKETAQFFTDLNKYARDNGISFSKPLRSFDDFTDDLIITDSGKEVIQLKQFFNDAIDWEHYSPLVYKSIREGRGNNFLSHHLNGFFNFNDEPAYSIGDLTINPVGIDSVVNAQYQMYLLEKGNAIMRKQYETDLMKYGVDSSEYKSLSDKYSKDILEYEKRKASITDNLIQSLRNSSHPDDVLLLSKILLNYNYNDLKIQQTQADWAGWNAFMNGASSAIGTAASVATPLL